MDIKSKMIKQITMEIHEDQWDLIIKKMDKKGLIKTSVSFISPGVCDITFTREGYVPTMPEKGPQQHVSLKRLYSMKSVEFTRTKSSPVEKGLMFNDGDFILDQHGVVVTDVHDWMITDLELPLEWIFKEEA